MCVHARACFKHFKQTALLSKKKPWWPVLKPQIHTTLPTPPETLSSYKYLHCPEMGAPRVIKMMEGCRKLSLRIFMKLPFGNLGRWGQEEVVGTFVGVTNYFRHLPFIPSFPLSMFCFVSINWIASLLDQGYVQLLSVEVSFRFPSRSPVLSCSSRSRIAEKPVRHPKAIYLFSPPSSCSFD